jgi:hypothetical protein
VRGAHRVEQVLVYWVVVTQGLVDVGDQVRL